MKKPKIIMAFATVIAFLFTGCASTNNAANSNQNTVKALGDDNYDVHKSGDTYHPPPQPPPPPHP